MRYIKKQGAFLLMAILLALILSGAVAATDSTNDTTNDNAITSSPGESQITDPIISGTVVEGPSNTRLSGATIRVESTSSILLAETTTGTDGTYSVSFISPDTEFKVNASKPGYYSYAKQITVALNPADPSDPNLYGTANFRLYTLPEYSGEASSYLLNVGALPDILLDIYVAKSSAWVDSGTLPYSTGEGVPLQVRLLSGDLLAGLLTVTSTDNEGLKIGSLIPADLPGLNAILQSLGLNVGALSGSAYSSTNPLESSGGSGVLSTNLSLLNLIQILNTGIISADSHVTPNFDTGALTASSRAGTVDIISILGGILQIQALQTNATAVANGHPGGAGADFTWSVADITLLGTSILDDLTADGVVELPGILRIALGSENNIVSPDGTYAFSSGDALSVQLLSLIPGSLVTLTLGHAQAEATVPVGGLDAETADLGISKVVDDANPDYLQNVTFTLTVHNYGPDDATNVQVTDTLPTGLTWISDDSAGAYNHTTGIWTISNLTNGAEAVLHIVAQVMVSNTQLTNIANVSGTEQDNNPDNDQSSATVNVGPASDLGISKVVDDANPDYLQNVTFTLTVHNYGPDDATNVQVTDTLPTGLTWISDDSAGAYNHTTGIWTISNLTNGAEAVLHIVAQVMVSNTQLTNIANVSGTEQDNNPDNDQSSATVNVGPASDLGISKTVNITTPKVGDVVTFTIIVKNNGPDASENVWVFDQLPEGLQFTDATANIGTYDPLTHKWNIGTLEPQGMAILNILTKAIKAGEMTNEAEVKSATHDPALENNKARMTVHVVPNPPTKPNPQPEEPVPMQPTGTTVPMQPTGIPLVGVLMAIIMILAGISISRRK